MSPRPQSAPASEVLVDLAMDLLEAGGPGAVTLRSVAEAAGVSTQVLYSRFGSKAELLVAMAVAGLARLDEALASVPARAAGTIRSRSDQGASQQPSLHSPRHPSPPHPSPQSGQPDPADLARAYQRFAHAHPHVYDLLFSPAADKHAQPAVAAASERVMARFLAAVTPYHPEPSAAWQVVQLAWASTHGVISLERSGHLSDPGGELVARVARALLTDQRASLTDDSIDHPVDARQPPRPAPPLP